MSGVKKVLVVGSSGFVGNYMMYTLATRYPNIQVVGMSRTALPRDDATAKLPNVSYIKGDALNPDSFSKQIEDVDGVIHCVGTLIEKKNNPKLTYDAMNRDTAMNVAAELQEYAEKTGHNRNFVLISSEKAPPFLDRYLTSKLEAEEFILKECTNLNSVMLRPGFIYNKQYRWWSIPLKGFVDLAWWMNEKVAKQMPFGSYFDFLFPAKSIRLSTLTKFAIDGVMGDLKDQKIIRNETLVKYDNEHPNE